MAGLAPAAHALRPSAGRVSGAGYRLGLNAMPGALRLRPTKLSDLDFVAAVEADAHNRPFISRAEGRAGAAQPG